MSHGTSAANTSLELDGSNDRILDAMALYPGTRVGPYKVSTLIGVGGMGEVYRATDTSLKRLVAIKVLPAIVASDIERLARFQREAEVLASLNHPNIATIYGLEKSEHVTALVMELVEGPTLADRIAKGPIPIDEALQIAAQIAEGLAAAHEQRVIHRDLKPANIKLRPDGTVKVLDFGLAKTLETTPAVSGSVSHSPTITMAMTQPGFILGTAAYMAPEQARGDIVDQRADIWAFGCVLYEMLTARAGVWRGDADRDDREDPRRARRPECVACVDASRNSPSRSSVSGTFVAYPPATHRGCPGRHRGRSYRRTVVGAGARSLEAGFSQPRDALDGGVDCTRALGAAGAWVLSSRADPGQRRRFPFGSMSSAFKARQSV